MMKEVLEHRYQPNIVKETSGGKLFFAVTPLTHLAGLVTNYSTASECLEGFYGDKAERDAVKQRVSDFLRFLQNEKNKNVKKLDKLQKH